jgi:hypothetical protein
MTAPRFISAEEIKSALLLAERVAGRQSPTDITFFKNAGGGHLDRMTAELIMRASSKN